MWDSQNVNTKKKTLLKIPFQKLKTIEYSWIYVKLISSKICSTKKTTGPAQFIKKVKEIYNKQKKIVSDFSLTILWFFETHPDDLELIKYYVCLLLIF
jgi:hypothetical protein